jgi:hypothetical protein
LAEKHFVAILYLDKVAEQAGNIMEALFFCFARAFGV